MINNRSRTRSRFEGHRQYALPQPAKNLIHAKSFT